MHKNLDIIEQVKLTRNYLLNSLADLSVADFNKIPAGFNNNIIWNLAHLVSAQQGICYKRSGLEVIIPEKYFLPFVPGTTPTKDLTELEIDEVKQLMISNLNDLKKDLEEGKFITYTEAITRYGVKLSSIEDAIGFLPFHEGMHTGYIMALKRAL